ncbi:MAG: tetratricopeptide repeat protein [Blastocatellia bacterium]|nr:tetratricopeptide repeat protein [Blastocatellia bacterium]
MASQTEFQPSSRFQANSRSAKFTPRNKYLPGSFRERAGGIALCIILLILPGPLATMRAKVFTAHYGGVSINSLQSAQDTRKLSPDKPVERELAPGQSHHYLLDLVEGQYVRLALEKKSAALVLIVSRPDGENITEAKGAPPQEPLGVVLIARVSGKHRLEVRSLAKDKEDRAQQGAPALYKLSIAELRTATEADHNRVAAAKAYTEGMRLLEKGDEQSLRESIEKFKAAMPLFEAVGKRKDEAAMLSYVGYVYSKLNQHAEAIEFYLQALSIDREIGNRSGETSALGSIAANYERLGERRKAIEYHSRALPVARAMADRSGEASALNNIGRIYNSLGEGRKALDFYNQAIRLYHETDDRRSQSDALRAAAGIHSSLIEYEKAIELLNQALALYAATRDRQGEAIALNNIGGVYSSLNEYQKAIDHYNKSLSLIRAAGNRRGEAAVLGNIGRVYLSLGDYEKALDQFNLSLLHHRGASDRLNEATALYHIGVSFFSMGDYRKALDFYNQALSLYRAAGNRRGEASALNATGGVHASSSDYQKALDFYNQALPLTRATGNRRGEAATLNNIGRIYLFLGDPQKALDFHNQALALIRQLRDRRGEAQMLYNIALAHARRGDLVEARSHSEAATLRAEELRQEVSSDQLRASFVASVRNFYDLNIDLLMQLHRQDPSRRLDRIALETSERARARSLIDLLVEARIDIREGVDAALLERERSLERLLDAKAERQARLLSGRHTPEQAAAAAKEIETILADYQQAQAQIRAASPRYGALTQPQPYASRDIQKQLLDEDTLLLEYALSHERSYLWAVSPDSITSYELPKREEIEAAARRFYELLRGGDSGRGNAVPRRGDTGTVDRDVSPTTTSRGRGELEEAALQLSRMLLSPVAGRLGSKRLVIVADGVLHYVPFAALPLPVVSGKATDGSVLAARQRTTDPYQPLILKNEIVTLPSASVLAEMRRDLAGRKAAAKAVAVFADPVFSKDDPRLKSGDEKKPTDATTESKTKSSETISFTTRNLQRSMNDLAIGEGFPRLPFTRREAQAIVAAVPASQVMRALDFQASRDAATEADLSDYRIVHFATHGLLNSRQPELSGIVFSLVDSEGKPQNGFLRLHEIYNMKLPAELVVLSACQTGLGKEIRGEGLVGLTRGFMYAGAARVVASLWKVDDAATAELMKRFYAGMLVKKLRPAAALREAQVEMWKQQRWRSAYYWAAFVLQGEWK